MVQCQSDRSQHKNRATAMNMLRARLFEQELQKRRSEKQAMHDARTDIGWGHQIDHMFFTLTRWSRIFVPVSRGAMPRACSTVILMSICQRLWPHALQADSRLKKKFLTTEYHSAQMLLCCRNVGTCLGFHTSHRYLAAHPVTGDSAFLDATTATVPFHLGTNSRWPDLRE